MIRSTQKHESFIHSGLDIGSNKICCAITEINPTSDSVKLLGIGTSPATGINKGSITHRDKLIDEMENAFQQAQTMADINIDNISLGISEKNYIYACLDINESYEVCGQNIGY